MTLLTRNPLPDFETMSLFQDLKLKRRKMDSRCSSDGESVADTSTFSPNLSGPISPSTSKLENTRISPTQGILSASDNRASSPDSGMSDGTTADSSHKDDVSPNSGELFIVPEIKEEPNPEVFENGDSPAMDESGSPDPRDPLSDDTTNDDEESVIRNLQQRRESVLMTGAGALAAWNLAPESRRSPEQRSRSSSASMKSESGVATNSSSASTPNGSSSACSGSGCSSCSSTSSLFNEPPVSSPANTNLYCSVIAIPPRFWVTTAGAAPNMLQTYRINGMRPELVNGVSYRESAQQPPITTAQKPSTSGARTTPTVIMSESGGVRTMIWSTPATTITKQPPNQRPAHQQNHQQVPQQPQRQSSPRQLSPQQPSPRFSSKSTSPQSATNWSQTNSSNGTSSEVAESEAHLLLNLGQEVPITRTPNIGPLVQHLNHAHSLQQQQQQQQQHSSQERSQSLLPLTFNMERLWAGDITQLPPSQQIQALNLSSPGSHAPAWTARNTDDTTNVDEPMPSTSQNNNEERNENGNCNEDQEPPMICMICEDKATGLHYGIITCEGCKGFFKRTVQNRRVYTCVADGVCEITKAQRNRCQYCRFKKCLERGMVLQAVREDRMPGGRNSGAVYNLYKVKYKKHKKTTRNGQTNVQTNGQSNRGDSSHQSLRQALQMSQHLQQQQQQQQNQQQNQSQPHHAHNQTQLQHQLNRTQQSHSPSPSPSSSLSPSMTSLESQQSQEQEHQQQKFNSSPVNSTMHEISPRIRAHLMNGTILKTALTNPSEIMYLRQRLEAPIMCYREPTMSFETSISMMQRLVDCDGFQELATFQNLEKIMDKNLALNNKLMHIGDTIVYKLVQWIKKLPFYNELPHDLITTLLTDRWHELLVLITCAYQAIHGFSNNVSPTSHYSSLNEKVEAEYSDQVANNFYTLQSCLSVILGRPMTLEQLRSEVGVMVEKMTYVSLMFRHMKLRMEEYVCLKVIAMLNPIRSVNSELEAIQDRYMTCLKIFMEHTNPHQPLRYQNMLDRLPEVQSAASLLLENKMFYVPFLLNAANHR